MAILPSMDWDHLGPRVVVATPLSGAGSLTLTGARAGWPVIGVTDTVTGLSAASSFERTITVANQIQQSGAVTGNHAVRIVIGVP